MDFLITINFRPYGKFYALPSKPIRTSQEATTDAKYFSNFEEFVTFSPNSEEDATSQTNFHLIQTNPTSKNQETTTDVEFLSNFDEFVT